MPEFSEADIRRIARAVRDYERREKGRTPARGDTAPRSAQVEIVRVTSTTTTAGRYPGKIELFDSGAGTDSDLADCWVVDVNGTTLAAQKYNARRVGDANGRPVFRVEAASAGSSGIEAKEADGTPDYTGVTILIVDQVTGGKLTQPAAGQAKIEWLSASASQIGVVDLSDQTLGAGTKKVDKLKVGTTASMPAGVDIFAPNSHWLSDNNHQTNWGDSSATNNYGGISNASAGPLHLAASTGGGAHDLHVNIDASNRKFSLTSTTDTTQPLYSCRGSDGISQTATLAKITAGGTNGSIVFTGGIATSYTAPT